MVIIQELESNNTMAHFANSFSTSRRKYNKPTSGGNGQTYLNHKPRQQNNNFSSQRNINKLRFNQGNNQDQNTYSNYN